MAKHLKLPNGYGSICKLSGKRRNPYAVYPPVKEFNINGSPIRPKAIGYFPSYTKALEALTEYNKRPFNTELRGLSYAQVFEMWSKVKFAEPNLSESSRKSYTVSFNQTKALHNETYSELRRENFQTVLDSSTLKYNSLRHIKNLWTQMGKFALENDIVSKDYASFVKLNKPNDVEMGVPFTFEEIARLWAFKDEKKAVPLLLMIYSGLRVTELKTVKIDLINNVFEGGIKTAAGKNRIIPIHSAIRELAETFNQEEFSVNYYQGRLLKPFLALAKIDTSHTCHDSRHTFSWLCDKYRVDDFSKHLMMGHSLGSDVERSVYGHRTVEELREEIEKIKKN